MPPYRVEQVNTREQMDLIVELIFKAQYRPYMPSAQILFPCFGYSAEARAEGMLAAQERLWKQHCKRDPSKITRVCVVDETTGDVVASMKWTLYSESPFPDGIPKVDLYWWPEGEAKEFRQSIVQQTLLPRSLWMHRQHGGVSDMVVHPDHRGRGAGGLMMEWNNKKLDDLGIEAFADASELGRALYEKWGYQVMMKVDFFHPLKRSQTYERLIHELTMPAYYAMWRPASGVVQPGTRTRPWL